MSVRGELVQYYRWLRQFGYNDSHSGNISARDAERVWITPTGACADTLSPADFVACVPGGLPPRGASGDAKLHLELYAANTQAQAVIHAHCPHAVALTMNGQAFVPPDFEGQLYFPEVPVITVPYDVYFEQAAGRVVSVLAEYPVCIVRGHGVYAWGETLNLAYKWTCSLEMSAKTAFIARQSGAVEQVRARQHL